MKNDINRILLTSKKYIGSVELLYLEGRLQRVSFENAVIEDKNQLWILRRVPLYEFELVGMMESAKGQITLVQDTYNVTLDDFIREYPYKRNTHLLPAVWGKLNTADQVRAWLAAREYRRYCDRNGWYKPKIAAAWLKNKEFLNDWKNL